MTSTTVIGTIVKNKREVVRIALDEYHGVKLLDIRVMAPLDDGSVIPTKKGLSLRVELLPELLAALEAAEAEARKQGLLPVEKERVDV